MEIRRVMMMLVSGVAWLLTGTPAWSADQAPGNLEELQRKIDSARKANEIKRRPSAAMTLPTVKNGIFDSVWVLQSSKASETAILEFSTDALKETVAHLNASKNGYSAGQTCSVRSRSSQLSLLCKVTSGSPYYVADSFILQASDEQLNGTRIEGANSEQIQFLRDDVALAKRKALDAGSRSTPPSLGSPSLSAGTGQQSATATPIAEAKSDQQSSSFVGWIDVYRTGDGSTSNGQIEAVDLRSVHNKGDLVEYRARNTLFGRTSEQTMYVNCATMRRGVNPDSLYSTFPDTLGGTELAAVCAYASSNGNIQPARR